MAAALKKSILLVSLLLVFFITLATAGRGRPTWTNPEKYVALPKEGQNHIDEACRRSRNDMLHFVNMLRLRLIKWSEEHNPSFLQYHKALYDHKARYDNPNPSVLHVYNWYIAENGDMLTTRYKNPYYRSRYFNADRVDKGSADIFEQLVKDDAIFSQIPSDFVEYKKYWADSRERYLGETKLSESDLALLRRKVYTETLDQTQAAVLDFRMDLIKSCYASLEVLKSNVADMFPSMTNIQSTTRIYNPQMNKCIGVESWFQRSVKSAIRLDDCDNENVDYDWYLIEVAKGDFVFKHIRSADTCLGVFKGMLSPKGCKDKDDNLVFNINRNDTSIVHSNSSRLLTWHVGRAIATFEDPTDGSQKWSVSAVYSNSAVLTASHYKKSNPKELIRNFPKILIAFMFKQFHGVESASKEVGDFCKGVEGLHSLVGLPKLCEAVKAGNTTLGASEDNYEAMRSSLVWYPDFSRMTAPGGVNKHGYQVFVSQTNATLIFKISDRDSKSFIELFTRFKDNDVFYEKGKPSKAGDIHLGSYYPTDDPKTLFQAKVTHKNSYTGDGFLRTNGVIRWLGIFSPNMIRASNMKYSGTLAFTLFANYLNDMYLRAGLNMISIINADVRYNEGSDDKYAVAPKMTIIKSYPKDDKGMDILVDDTRSIMKGFSPFNLLTSNRKLLAALNDIIGISRLGDDDFGMIPIPKYNSAE